MSRECRYKVEKDCFEEKFSIEIMTKEEKGKRKREREREESVSIYSVAFIKCSLAYCISVFAVTVSGI
jgi:hypothetical protein